MTRHETCDAPDCDSLLTMNEVVEISALLPGPLAAALEQKARREGLTTGRMVRRILRDALAPAEAEDESEQ